MQACILAVSVSFCTSVPSSPFALPQALHASHLFIAWPGRLERRKNPAFPFHPQYRTSLLSPSATRSASNPTLVHMCIQYSHNAKRREREPANQPICKSPQFIVHTSPTPSPSSSSSSSTIPFLFHSIATQISYLHPTSTLLHMRQVLPARRVPRRHVLLHAVGVAGRFA
jgi:hypothetical protein